MRTLIAVTIAALIVFIVLGVLQIQRLRAHENPGSLEVYVYPQAGGVNQATHYSESETYFGQTVECDTVTTTPDASTRAETVSGAY